MLSSKRTLWSALERIGLREAFLQQDAMDASESSGRFGIRWHPAVDLLKLPNTPGIAILFYKNQRFQVAEAPNIFRHIHQCYRAPGMSLVAFSWLAIEHPIEQKLLRERLQRLEYDALWEYEWKQELGTS